MQIKKTSKFICVIIVLLLILCSNFIDINHQSFKDSFATEIDFTIKEDLTIVSKNIYENYIITGDNDYLIIELYSQSLDEYIYNLSGSLFSSTKHYTINFDKCSSNCSTVLENSPNSNTVLVMNKDSYIADPYIIIAINEHLSVGSEIQNTYYLKYDVIFDNSYKTVFFTGYEGSDSVYHTLEKKVLMKSNVLSTENFLDGSITSFSFLIYDYYFEEGDKYIALLQYQTENNYVTSSVVDNVVTIEFNQGSSDIIKINIVKQNAQNIVQNTSTFYMSINCMFDEFYSIQTWPFYMEDVNLDYMLPMNVSYYHSYIDLSMLNQVWYVYPTSDFVQEDIENYPVALIQHGSVNAYLDLNNLLESLYPLESYLPSARYTVCLCLYDAASNLVGYAQTVLPISQNKTTVEYVIECIENIGTVSYNQACLEKIEYVENEYLALSELERTQVTNYGKLTSARRKYNNLKVADDCRLLINQIGDVSYNSTSLEKIVTAENFYNNLTGEQKLLVSNSQTLLDARNEYDNLKYEREFNLENSLDTISLDCSDTVILYLRQEEWGSNFSISATGMFAASGLVCDWYLTSNNLLEYYSSGNTIYLIPYSAGECDLIALYKFESGKTLCKTIKIKILQNAPQAILKITKDGDDAFNIYDNMSITASYDCDFVFDEYSYCEWYIDGVQLNDTSSFKIEKVLTSGSHKIKVKIFEYEDAEPNVAETEIYVYDVKDVEKTLSLSYKEKIYAYVGGGEFDIYAYIDSFKDNNYSYNWSIGDTSIVNYAYEHLNRNYVILNPLSAGTTKLYVMVNVGNYESKTLVCELEIEVFETINKFNIIGIDSYCKPDTIADFKMNINDKDTVVNVAPVWEIYRNDEKLDIVNHTNLLNYKFDSTGNYTIKLNYENESATVEINCASIDVNTLLITLVPFFVIVTCICIVVWIIIKRKKDNMLVIKENFDNLEQKVSFFIEKISNSEIDLQKIKKKCNNFSTRLLISFKELRIKTENVSLENMIEVESVYKNIDDSILTLEAYKNNIDKFSSKRLLIKVFDTLKNSNIIICSSLMEEKLLAKEKFLEQVKGNINKVDEKTFQKDRHLKKKFTQKDYEEYLKRKNCYYADDNDSADDD